MHTLSDSTTSPLRSAPVALEPLEKQLRELTWVVRTLDNRIARAGCSGSGDQLVLAQYRALGEVSVVQQQKLIRAARELPALAATCGQDTRAAERMAERARTLFIVGNTGAIERAIKKALPRFSVMDRNSALELLRQSGRQALNRVVDTYDFEGGANPLTYALYKLMDELTELAAREGRELRLPQEKERALGKIERAVKALKEQGLHTDLDVLSELSGLRAVEIEQLLPLLQQAERFCLTPDSDSTGDSAEASASAGSRLAHLRASDEHSTPEAIVIAEDTAENLVSGVASALAQLRAEQRLVLELLFGFGGDSYKQCEIYQGLYRDANGNAYSSEPTVLAASRRDDVVVIERKQAELNRLYKAGELSFEAATPAAQKWLEEVGAPPTSGTVQKAYLLARTELATNDDLKDLVS